MTRDNFNRNGQPAVEPVAVIGISCLFPGAENLAAYWAAIKNGLNAIGEIPSSHWSAEDYYDPDPKAEDKTYGKRGGFLKPVPFEPLKYGIVPNDISAIDTTQILGLIAADKALADAGYQAGGGYDHSRTAVLLGVTGALKMVVTLGQRLAHPQLRRALQDSGVDPETAAEVLKRFKNEFTPWQENSFPGLLGNVTAGRIANRLNLGGTNLVVDAACASSLAAMRQGFMELASGQTDMVVSGGLDTFSDPFMYTCFSKTPALSPTGDVHAYDQDGDGTMLGEGIGVVILKRLSDAERDGDRIYSVIKAIGSSSDGKGAAIFAPTAEGQVRALKNAYDTAGVDMGTVGLVEGHGTGTAVGDAVEVEALARVFGESGAGGDCRPWCALGSVKSQIGHAKAAAGVAGLIKASLALYLKTLPPTAKVRKPLARISEPGSPFYMSTFPRPWLSRDRRRAGVSAFGFGGSNFHAVLEEYETVKPAAEGPDYFDLFTFSGEHPADVAAALSKAAKADNHSAAAFRSRQNFNPSAPCRLILPRGESFPALVREMARILTNPEFSENDLPEGVFFSRKAVPAPSYGYIAAAPETVCQNVFRELAVDWPELIEALSEEAAELSSEAPDLPPLGLMLYPPDLASEECRSLWEKSLSDLRARQAAARAFSKGLAAILGKFGLQPQAVIETLEEASQPIDCWLELSPAEVAAPALRSAGHQALAFDFGDDQRGHLALAHLLGRLSTMGIPVDFKAWPGAPLNRPEEETAAGSTFTVMVSGANIYVKKEIAPSQPRQAHQALPAAGNAALISLMEQMSAETARLHQNFLDHQMEALKIMQGLNPAAGGQPAIPPLPAAAVQAAPAYTAAPSMPLHTQAENPVSGSTDVMLQVIAEETGYPVEMLNLSMNLESDLGLDSIKKVEIMSALSEKLPEVQGLGAETINEACTLGDLAALIGPGQPVTGLVIGKPAPQKSGRPSSGLWETLREVVASETGYPLEMLRPEMSLTDDLGLDSIKLVEIASLMSERLPDAPALSADVLNGALTLGDLAAAMEGSSGSPAPVNAVLQPAASAASPGSSPLDTILETVAGETGYPRDMLQLSMSLEGDLGLDSIKKVEIMSALSEKMPELDALNTADVMAGLETLADLAALVEGGKPASGTSAPSAAVSRPSAKPEASSNTADPGELLLDVVSEETGYPRDMLSFDASLEGDLGLDSIKRVEIMAALSEKLGDDSLASSAEVISGAVTLGDLRGLLVSKKNSSETAFSAPETEQAFDAEVKEAKKRGPGRPPKNSPPAFKEPEEKLPSHTTSVTPFKVEMVTLPLTHNGMSAGLAAGARVLIVSSVCLLAEVLEKHFNSQGMAVRSSDWDQAEQLAAENNFDALILVWPGDSRNLKLAGQAFKILKAAAPALKNAATKGGSPLLLGLTFMGGEFGFNLETGISSPDSAALAGLVKSAGREWTQVRTRVVDLPLAAYDLDANAYAADIAAAAGQSEAVEAGIPEPGRIMSPRLAQYKLKNIRVRHLREGQTLLVTGGARGVTAAAIKELARSFRPKLVILGRTPLQAKEPAWLRDRATEAAVRQAIFDNAAEKPAPRELAKESALIMAGREIRDNLAAMEKAGAKVVYISGDFDSPDALESVLAEIRHKHGPIHGFIHGAGVLADALIEDKKSEDFERVFATKAIMASRILDGLHNDPLHFVAFFSSSTARFGRKGQSDYAAGNEVLNKLARELAGRHGPKCLSVNWGPWAGGMVDASLARLFEGEGIGLIPLAEGARLFAALAGAPKNDPVEVVVLGPQTDLGALN